MMKKSERKGKKMRMGLACILKKMDSCSWLIKNLQRKQNPPSVKYNHSSSYSSNNNNKDKTDDDEDVDDEQHICKDNCVNISFIVRSQVHLNHIFHIYIRNHIECILWEQICKAFYRNDIQNPIILCHVETKKIFISDTGCTVILHCILTTTRSYVVSLNIIFEKVFYFLQSIVYPC